MRTTIDIDDKVLRQAMKVTGARTKREAVDIALREIVMRRKRRDILKLAGKVEWIGDLSESRRNHVFDRRHN